MKKKILIFIGVVLLLFVGVIGYFVVSDLKQEELLKQEIVNWGNKDLATGDYSIEVKTKGDYAYIEEAIKKFYRELSDQVKSLNYYFDNQDLIQILSPSSLEKGRPDFRESYQMLEDVKKNGLGALDKITSLCDEETIKGLIDREKVDDYYYDLYLELMYTEEDLKEFRVLKEEMKKVSSDLEAFLQKVEEILTFLKTNNSQWYIENGQLYLETSELVNTYNQLYNELQELAKQLSDDNLEGNTSIDGSQV